MAGIFRRAYFPPKKKRYAKGATTASVTMAPGVGALVFTGFTPALTIGTGVTLTPGVGLLAFVGNAADFENGTGTTATPGAGSVVFTGLAPTFLSQPDAVFPGLGLLAITGNMPTVTGNAVAFLAPGVGRLQLFGHAPSIESAEPVVTGGADDRTRANWLEWKKNRRPKKPEPVVPPPPAIPEGTPVFAELLAFLEQMERARLAQPRLTPEEQAADDAEIERLLMGSDH